MYFYCYHSWICLLWPKAPPPPFFWNHLAKGAWIVYITLPSPLSLRGSNWPFHTDDCGLFKILIGDAGSFPPTFPLLPLSFHLSPSLSWHSYLPLLCLCWEFYLPCSVKRGLMHLQKSFGSLQHELKLFTSVRFSTWKGLLPIMI